MSKITADQIKHPNGPALTLPNTKASENKKQYLTCDTSGNLFWTDLPSQKVGKTFTQANSSPFIFAHLANYINGYHAGNGYTFTSEIPAIYSGGVTQLQILTGRNSNDRMYSTQFVIPPRIEYITGSRGEFSYSTEQTTYADTSSKFNYPDRLMGVIFVKNTTQTNISRTIYGGFSCFWNSGYEGAAAFLLTPNATNTQISANNQSITSLAETTAYQTTASSAATSSSATITIPADKTVAILYSNPPYYATNSSGYQFAFLFRIYDFFQSTMTTGLEIDIIRTNRALQNPIHSESVVDIWK